MEGDIRKRKGIFRIATDVIFEDHEEIYQVMGKVIIVRAENLFNYDAIEYQALSPEFDLVPDGQWPYHYDVTIKRNEDGSKEVIFERARK